MITRRVLFTSNGLDGVGCAILFRKVYHNAEIAFTDYKEGFNAGEINDTVMSVIPNLNGDDQIMISDISVNHHVAEYLNGRGGVGLIDNNGDKYLNKYPWANVDISKSGTLMLYEVLSKNYLLEDYLPMVEAIDAFDLWRKDTQEFSKGSILNSLLHLMGRDPFIRRFVVNSDITLSEGEELLIKCDFTKCRDYVSRSIQLAEIGEDDQGFKVAKVLAERYIPQIGDGILEVSGDIDYVAVINVREGTVNLIGKDKVDLGKIAEEHGGGGYYNSAGFTIHSTVNITPKVK